MLWEQQFAIQSIHSLLHNKLFHSPTFSKPQAMTSFTQSLSQVNGSQADKDILS